MLELDRRDPVKTVRVGNQHRVVVQDAASVGLFYAQDVQVDKYFYFEQRFKQLAAKRLARPGADILLSSKEALIASALRSPALAQDFLAIVRRKGVEQVYRWPFYKTMTSLDAGLQPDYRRAERRAELFEAILRTPLPAIEEIVHKDSLRTARSKELFAETNSLGTVLLERVCKALAAFFPRCEYVQGMNFVVMFCLEVSGLEELETWNVLVDFFKKDKNLYFGLYEHNFPLLLFLKFAFHRLLALLDSKLETALCESLPDELYLTKWFLTFFCVSLTKPFLARSWDFFMLSDCLGPVWVALEIVQQLRPLILGKDMARIAEAIASAETLCSQLDFTRFVKSFKRVDRLFSRRDLLGMLDAYSSSLTEPRSSEFAFYDSVLRRRWSGPTPTEFEFAFVSGYADHDSMPFAVQLPKFEASIARNVQFPIQAEGPPTSASDMGHTGYQFPTRY